MLWLLQLTNKAVLVSLLKIYRIGKMAKDTLNGATTEQTNYIGVVLNSGFLKT